METKTKNKAPLIMPRWLPTPVGLHARATTLGLLRYWAGLCPMERRQRLASSLLDPENQAKAEAARRHKLKGPAHRKRVSQGMRRYWARRRVVETMEAIYASRAGGGALEDLLGL